jgi:16S rRNA (guanine966-N2)-methyltransferase
VREPGAGGGWGRVLGPSAGGGCGRWLGANLGGMTRVIAGAAGGRRLSVPGGRDTRPTSDRAREGLFATVRALAGPLAGASVLDLYAGSGALGLEALSRGAARVCLVEADPRAVRVIRANVAALGLPGAEVVAGRVEAVLARGPASLPGPADTAKPQDHAGPGSPQDQAGPGSPRGHAGPRGLRFDVVVADPPYATPGEEVTAVLAALADRGWLTRGALLAVERSTRSGPVDWPAGYTADRSRRYGEATFWYGLATSALPAATAPRERRPELTRSPGQEHRPGADREN